MNILKAVLFVVNKLGLVQPTAKVKKQTNLEQLTFQKHCPKMLA